MVQYLTQDTKAMASQQEGEAAAALIVLNQNRYSSDEDDEDIEEVPLSYRDEEEINFLDSLDKQLKKVQQELFVARAKISSRQRKITESHRTRTKRRKISRD